MAIDPRIILGASNRQSPGFANFLSNLKSIDQVKQDRALRPIQEQLAQLNLQQAQGGAREQRIRSVALGAAEIAPFLESGDIEGARGRLTSRRARLIQQGIDTSDTDEALQMLDSNPQLLKQRVNQSVELGNRLGVFGGQRRVVPGQKGETRLIRRTNPETGQEETISVTDVFDPNTGSIRQVESPIEGEVLTRRGETGTEETFRKVETERGKTEAKLSEKIRAIPETERVQFLSSNLRIFEGDIAESRSVLDEIDRAIEIWQTAPGTISGPGANRLPSLKADTQELESILAGLGIDRLSNFKGATSERELATAFRAGASIEQGREAGIRRLKKQRRDIVRNNDRLRGLVTEAKGLLRRQPEQAPAALFSSSLSREVSEQDIQDTLQANPGVTREQLFQQLGIQ